jgi:hypothetical protein
MGKREGAGDVANSDRIGYKRIIVLTVIATTAGILADKFGIIDAIVRYL